MKINKNFQNIAQSYLFSNINKKVSEYKAQNPNADIIKLGIGDVTLPLCDAVTTAMNKAVDEQKSSQTFRGYGPEQGYDFLHEAVRNYYESRGIELTSDEIFISDGAKSDVGNILDLFDKDNTVLIPDPVYPVYADTNTMAGRKIVYLNANKENGFLPVPNENTKGDIIYLCSPNNPTGAVYSKEQLKKWVDYANDNDALILFDAAYEAFIGDRSLPGSIFDIEGAKTCAIEFCSLSKTAGFTGVRCGYTIVPNSLEFEGASINKMWLRRQTTKFNGVPYIVQRGAEAVFTKEGYEQTRAAIEYYKENAKILAQCFDDAGIWYTGGKHSPYIWFECPNGMKSWDFFDLLLTEANIVGTPGSGFGANGEGFFRMTAFNTKENTQKAVERLKKLLAK